MSAALRLLVLLAGFALTGYVGAALVASSHWLAVVVWFVAAALAHDLLLVPSYALLDRLAGLVPWRPRVAWRNHLRVPAALSALLLLVWAPLVLRLSAAPYAADTTQSADVYLTRWLDITGALFAVSALAFGLRWLLPERDQHDLQHDAERDLGG